MNHGGAGDERPSNAICRYGYRRITALLHHQGWTVNSQTIDRTLAVEG